jgi:hypothetical protein
LGGCPQDEELPSRTERRNAVRERHRLGGPAWSNRDRHLDPGSRMSIADAADPGVAGAVGTVIGNVLRRRKRS